MRVIPFPGGRDGGREVDPDESWLSELEAALNGTGEGPSADSWRALREDVRAQARGADRRTPGALHDGDVASPEAAGPPDGRSR